MDIEFLSGSTKDGTKYWVPVANGRLLHSFVDPFKEAREFVDQEWDRIKLVRSVLVFGLGGGFHIAELLRRKNFNVVVLEAFPNLVRDVVEKNREMADQIEIIAGLPPAHVHKEPAVIEVLGHSFAILKHPASWHAAPFYYSAVTKILNERTLKALRQFSEKNPSLKKFLDSLEISEEQTLTLPMLEAAMIRRGSGIEKEGLIWMTLRELVV